MHFSLSKNGSIPYKGQRVILMDLEIKVPTNLEIKGKIIDKAHSSLYSIHHLIPYSQVVQRYT